MVYVQWVPTIYSASTQAVPIYILNCLIPGTHLTDCLWLQEKFGCTPAETGRYIAMWVKMMNFVFKTGNFVFKTRKFVLKTRKCVLKTRNSARIWCTGWLSSSLRRWRKWRRKVVRETLKLPFFTSSFHLCVPFFTPILCCCCRWAGTTADPAWLRAWWETMMNFVQRTRDCVSKTRHCVLKTRRIVCINDDEFCRWCGVEECRAAVLCGLEEPPASDCVWKWGILFD